MATRLGQTGQELARTNAWWRGPGWEARDPDLRRLASGSLVYESPVLHDLREGGLYVLRGPRRVGKPSP